MSELEHRDTVEGLAAASWPSQQRKGSLSFDRGHSLWHSHRRIATLQHTQISSDQNRGVVVLDFEYGPRETLFRVRKT